MVLCHNYLTHFNEGIKVIHVFEFLMGISCTWLCRANSEISSGKLWIYSIFHSTAKMWRSHLFFLTVMISIYLQSYGRYIQRTFALCPLLVLTHSLISAINAELCYAYFLVLFSFCFVSVFHVLIGTTYSIQRSGNIILAKTNMRSVKVCRSYEHREIGL